MLLPDSLACPTESLTHLVLSVFQIRVTLTLHLSCLLESLPVGLGPLLSGEGGMGSQCESHEWEEVLDD